MGIKSLNNNSVMPETPMRLPGCRRGEFQQEDEEAIIGYDALYDSMEKCMRGVSWKASVAHFVLNAPRGSTEAGDTAKGRRLQTTATETLHRDKPQAEGNFKHCVSRQGISAKSER